MWVGAIRISVMTKAVVVVRHIEHARACHMNVIVVDIVANMADFPTACVMR